MTTYEWVTVAFTTAGACLSAVLFLLRKQEKDLIELKAWIDALYVERRELARHQAEYAAFVARLDERLAGVEKRLDILLARPL